MVQQHWIWLACLGLLASACDSDDTEEEAVEGTIPLDLGTGRDSFWIDTDGVEPEIAGCHIEFSSDSCTTLAASARNFGEFCQEDGTLVESTPDADECHTHDNDIGHPYVVDCVAWCRDALTLPNGDRRGFAVTTGTCEAVRDIQCDREVIDSARCVCE